MKKLAELIVKYRHLIMTLFLGLIAYSLVCIPKVNIEYEISSYLPADTDTAQALDIMDSEFVTYGTTTIVVNNISYQTALDLKEKIEVIDGVKDLPFENNDSYFNNSKALYKITFDGDADDKRCVDAYYKIKDLVSDYDYYESVSLVDNYADSLAHDMHFIIVLTVIVIVVVLTFTSRSYAEVLVLLMVFSVAAILNMGTNYWFGTISFVSNSICVILQLALAIDYSIILLHRFIEECDANPSRSKVDSMIEALSKSIGEICGSSLTTISGLMALTCMTFALGKDLGLVLSKSIVWSILTVVLLMPSLLLKFSNLIQKTKHKNFVPSIDFLGKAILKVKYINVILFLSLVLVGGLLSFKIRYCYTNNGIESFEKNEVQIANEIIADNFGNQNQFVIVVPNGDYARQKELLSFMEEKDYISEAIGLANIEVKDGYYLCDLINYQDLVDLLEIDNDLAKMLFYYYAISEEDYSIFFNDNINRYKVTIIDLLDKIFELKDDNYLDFSQFDEEDIDDLREQLDDGKKQLLGPNYSRMVFNLDMPEEGEETFALMDTLREEIREIYPEAICGGNTMVAYDLNSNFVSDNLLISFLTIFFVFIVLMFNFRSWGLPILLVCVIQGAIFINFSVPVLINQNVFFFVYLIASSIQMGATIDYAIVISGRYEELRKTLSKKDSVIRSLTEAFPTIISSGAILTIAALLIGMISSDLLISSIGYTISRGTIISILSVMIVLPILLYFFDKPLSYTYFKEKQKKVKSISSKDKNLINDLTLSIFEEWQRLEEAKKNEEEKEMLENVEVKENE